MNKRFRLKNSSDFQRVRRAGKAIAHPFVVLLYLPNGLDQVRIGVAAGKSVGNAVQRNRAKRVMRAAMQSLLEELKPGNDIVLIARKPILEAKTPDLIRILQPRMKNAGLLE
ncbi:MAG: ribonuclease P protein component [Anaerolineales bacterium]|nr:ribonuclease P protein component [Anaerolineales bacterium]